MTPFLENMPLSARLAFWSASQFENFNLPNQITKKSLILNPFKTEKLIASALCHGIKKMVVSDIEEVIKIQ